MAKYEVEVIISISKLLGNYNKKTVTNRGEQIISISKLLGNYNKV